MSANIVSIWVKSLGCPKNRVDTEKILGSLGGPVKTVAHMGRADLVLINTCAFIEPATRESIRAILDSIEKIKTLKRKPRLVVAGCLPGRYGLAELAKELPEVDLWLHPREQAHWPEQIQILLGLPRLDLPGRIKPVGSSYAWLKIGEGCRHKCAFCAIPAIRGDLNSLPEEQIVSEAACLLENDVQEIVLVAQDVTSWGQDMGNSGADNFGLPGLLRKLCALPGLGWLRMLYLYPAGITDELLACVKELGQPLLPYFDIPFQHSAPAILRSMGRPFAANPYKVVDKIRKVLPDAALRTTLITGYPGETEADFLDLCAFVRNVEFNNVGVFAYQQEDGTKAALLPDQIDPVLREERRQALMEIQAGISRQKLSACLGKNMTVLVDEPRHEEWPGLHAGRVWFQAPEIDGITYVSGNDVKPCAMLKCEIVDSYDYDLSALA